MISVFLLKTEKLNDDGLFAEYYLKMSDYRKGKTDRMRMRRDKNLSLGAGILIDNYLRTIGLCEKDMVYEKLPNGKPYFKDCPEIHFNISHSDNAVICAFSENDVGCDIEKLTEANTEIAKRFFTESESDFILSADDKDIRTDRFFRLWTLKESFLKCTGEGLGGGLSSFEICFDGEIYVKQNDIRTNHHFKEFIIPDYRIAVCSEYDNFTEKPDIMEI